MRAYLACKGGARMKAHVLIMGALLALTALPAGSALPHARAQNAGAQLHAQLLAQRRRIRQLEAQIRLLNARFSLAPSSRLPAPSPVAPGAGSRALGAAFPVPRLPEGPSPAPC